MPQIGRYVGGEQFVIIGDGVRVTATTPASANVSGTQRNGMEWIEDCSRIADPLPVTIGPQQQGFDGRVFSYSQGGLPYNSALNVDPGATSQAFEITTPGVLVKAISRPTDFDETDKGALSNIAPVFFVDAAPATDSLPPPIGATPLVSRYVKTDIDFTLLPNETLPASAPSASALLGRHRWYQQMWMPTRSAGDWYVNRAAEQAYGTVSASDRISGMLLTCCNIDSTIKERLAIQYVIAAQNVLEVVKQGGNYNQNTGLGGVLPGYKALLIYAGLLTDDAEMLEYADPDQHDLWAEDGQIRYVDQNYVDTYDYIQDDLGMPEWFECWTKDPARNERALEGNYRSTFRGHQFGQAALLTLMTGGVAAWNNQAFFDYCERMARRTVFKDPGSQVAWGFLSSDAYPAPQFHKDMYTTHVPSGWDWPA